MRHPLPGSLATGRPGIGRHQANAIHQLRLEEVSRARRREQVQALHGDRRGAGGRLAREQGRQKVRVENGAGAVSYGVYFDVGVVHVPQLAHAIGDEQPAAAFEHGHLRAAFHLAPDRLATGPRGDLQHRIGEVFTD